MFKSYLTKPHAHSRRAARMPIALLLIVACLSQLIMRAPAQPPTRTAAQAEDEVLALYEQALKLEAARQDEAARPLIERVLTLAERELGLTHPGIPILLVNVTELAKRFDNNGDYARAERLYQRALTLDEKAARAARP